MNETENTAIGWGERIRTSDWLIQSQLITPVACDFEFRSNLANSTDGESAGRPTDTPNQLSSRLSVIWSALYRFPELTYRTSW